MKPIVSAFFAMQIAWLGFGVAAMGQTIKVGVVTPLTGRYAAIGNELKHGYDIAVEKINAGGGVQVGNRRLLLELNVLDDEFPTWVWDLPWRAFTSRVIAISSRLFGSRRKSPEKPIVFSMAHWRRINVLRR